MWKAEVAFFETEDAKIVKSTLSNFFKTKITKSENRFKTKGSNDKKDLETLKQKIWNRKILDAVRKQLYKNKLEDSTKLYLHKQAAAKSRVSIIANPKETSLGVVEVEIPFTLVDWLAPRTKDGVPIL